MKCTSKIKRVNEHVNERENGLLASLNEHFRSKGFCFIFPIVSDRLREAHVIILHECECL